MRILFVCLGNICRSPTAEGVMRHLIEAEQAAVGPEIEIDSAGTGSWHLGSPPDERATAAAAARGITLEGGARRVELEDFDSFDLIVAMDRQNESDLGVMVSDPAHKAKVRLLRAYDPAAIAAGEHDVPDPYYGGERGFEHVLDVVESACEHLLQRIRAEDL